MLVANAVCNIGFCLSAVGNWGEQMEMPVRVNEGFRTSFANRTPSSVETVFWSH